MNLTKIWTYSAPRATFTHTAANTVTASGTDPLSLSVSNTDSVTIVVTFSVNVDVKPGSLPIGFGLNGKGVVPVAILGGISNCTIDEIDLDSIKLNGIPTVMVDWEDSAILYLGTDICGCHDLKKNGNSDIVFQVDAPTVIQTLSDTAKNSLLPLPVTGNLIDRLTLIKEAIT